MKKIIALVMLLTLSIGAMLFTSCSDEGLNGMIGDTKSWLNGSTWMISGTSQNNGHTLVLTLGFNGGQVTYQEYDQTAGTVYNVYGPFQHNGRKITMKWKAEYQGQKVDFSVFPTVAYLADDDSYILYNDNKFAFQQDW